MDKKKMKKQVKEIVRFDTKTEIKVLKALDKVLDEGQEIYKEDEFKELFTTDESNVMGVLNKTQEAFNILRKFVVRGEEKKAPDFNYSDALKSGSDVKISGEYLKEAINILNATGEESLTITTAKDFPITLENKHFKIVIAPRVETD